MTTLLEGLRAHPTIDIFGPTSAATGLQALLRASSVDALCDALAATAPAARTGGRLRIAVDPLRV